ncbi:MAG: hypothetical protein AAF471_03610 [Myxococcota bacterium]
MIGLYGKLAKVGVIGVALLQGAAALAQENIPEQSAVATAQEDSLKNKAARAVSPRFLDRPRTTVFGNVGFTTPPWRWSGRSGLGMLGGGGTTVEVPLARHVVVGGYLASSYLIVSMVGTGTAQGDAGSATTDLAWEGEQPAAVLEGGGLVKIRLPFNDHVAWYFPIRGGVGGLFADSGAEFLGAFHAGLVGVEASLGKHVGITFDAITSLHKPKGPLIVSNDIELGVVFTW